LVNYKIQISASAEKSLRKVPVKDMLRLVQVIQALAVNPRPAGARKLAGEENTFRVRQGSYRVIYEVKDQVLLILVLKIGHRKDVYR